MKLHKLIPLLQHWKMLRKKAEQLKIDMISWAEVWFGNTKIPKKKKRASKHEHGGSWKRQALEDDFWVRTTTHTVPHRWTPKGAAVVPRKDFEGEQISADVFGHGSLTFQGPVSVRRVIGFLIFSGGNDLSKEIQCSSDVSTNQAKIYNNGRHAQLADRAKIRVIWGCRSCSRHWPPWIFPWTGIHTQRCQHRDNDVIKGLHLFHRKMTANIWSNYPQTTGTKMDEHQQTHRSSGKQENHIIWCYRPRIGWA
jgi:hypothetical protein